MQTFYQKLTEAMKVNETLLCLGLDPDPMQYPDAFPHGYGAEALRDWGIRLIEATSDLVCCYKPNTAFYEQFGADGLQALQETITAVPDHLPTLLDAKRADIGSTAIAYARAVFDILKADAVTLNPYLGRDSVGPFLSHTGKAVFVMGYNSNPSAAVFQAYPSPENPLYLFVVQEVQTWGDKEQVGFIAGATQPEALAKIRQAAPDRLILSPGIGTQGGNLTQALSSGLDENKGGLIVPVSRAILYSGNPHGIAEQMKQKINQERGL